jgi:hypothetical protein
MTSLPLVRWDFLYIVKGGAFGAAAGRTAACGSPGLEGWRPPAGDRGAAGHVARSGETSRA